MVMVGRSGGVEVENQHTEELRGLTSATAEELSEISCSTCGVGVVIGWAQGVEEEHQEWGGIEGRA